MNFQSNPIGSSNLNQSNWISSVQFGMGLSFKSDWVEFANLNGFMFQTRLSGIRQLNCNPNRNLNNSNQYSICPIPNEIEQGVKGQSDTAVMRVLEEITILRWIQIFLSKFEQKITIFWCHQQHNYAENESNSIGSDSHVHLEAAVRRSNGNEQLSIHLYILIFFKLINIEYILLLFKKFIDNNI